MAFLLSAVFSVLKWYTCVVAWVVAAVAGGVATILGKVVSFCQVSWVVVKWVTMVLDNKHLFYYGFLLDYLHLMVGRTPLVAYLRASQRSHDSQSKTVSVKLAVLRRAWNAFARLLSINFETAFQC